MTMTMTDVQRENRERAFYRLYAALTVLEAMAAALFPTVEQTAPPDANDLAARIEALAATWGG